MAQIESQKDLGTLLLEEGLIDEGQLATARRVQHEQEKSIGRVLVEMGLITEQAKMTFLHKKFDFEIVDISEMTVPREILTRIARSFAEKHRCVPILFEDGHLVVAMEDPTDIVVIDGIKAQAGSEVLPVLAPAEDIERLIAQYPAVSQGEADQIRRRAQQPVWLRFLHTALFILILLLPLLVFALAAQLSSDFALWAAGNAQDFDFVLYLLLGWALWAIVVWELDGLFFRQSE